MLRPIRDKLRRLKITVCGSWETQPNRDEPVWHCHLLVSGRININMLRRFAVQRGWGQQMRIDSIAEWKRQHPWVNGNQGIAKYLAKYMRKATDVPKSIRLGIVSRAERTLTKVKDFHWVGGKARAFRRGCTLFLKIYGRPPTWKNHDRVNQLGELRCSQTLISMCSVEAHTTA
jgi:hypothetical protein